MTIIVVLQFPPRESLSNLVNFESQYGMWDLGFESVKAAITLPKHDKDWLIFFDSSNLLPVAPVTQTDSDPAKSTRLSFPTLTYLSPSTDICSTTIKNTAWDQEDTSFIFV